MSFGASVIGRAFRDLRQQNRKLRVERDELLKENQAQSIAITVLEAEIRALKAGRGDD